MACNEMSYHYASEVISSLSQIVPDLWTIGYNGKIHLWSIKSRNEDAVTLFLTCFVDSPEVSTGLIWDPWDPSPQFVPPVLTGGQTDGQGQTDKWTDSGC